jgi:hypothetical protein
MLFVIPVESIVQKLGGVILYDPEKNKIVKQYVHNKKWGGQRVGWRGGKLYQDMLIATDWTDLHYFDVKNWKYVKKFEKDSFNDLHYVEVFNDQLYVVNTGLDSVEIFTNPFEPQHVETIYMFERFPKFFKKRKLDKKGKYNDKFKIKPHVAHPNCIASNGKYMFVTCFQKWDRSETGEIVELNHGGKLTRRSYSCHDGNFYKDSFILSNTRKANLIFFDNINEAKLPYKTPSRTISLGQKGWWRGMVCTNGYIFVFASLYAKKKIPARMAVVRLQTGEVKRFVLPCLNDVYWDTVYQPNLYEV